MLYGGSGQVKTGWLMSNENETAAIILVVEDVEEIRDGIEKLLASNGYGIEPAKNEGDAVRRARRRHPDLILVSSARLQADLIGRGRRIREHAGLSREIPVVIFGSDAVAEGAELAIGENTYIIRPDSFNQLRSYVRDLLPAPSGAQ
jgi:CheY-like chemotaxis protein